MNIDQNTGLFVKHNWQISLTNELKDKKLDDQFFIDRGFVFKILMTVFTKTEIVSGFCKIDDKYIHVYSGIFKYEKVQDYLYFKFKKCDVYRFFDTEKELDSVLKQIRVMREPHLAKIAELSKEIKNIEKAFEVEREKFLRSVKSQF